MSTPFIAAWNSALPGQVSDLSGSADVSSITLTYTPSVGATKHQYRQQLSGSGSWSAAATLSGSVLSGLSSATSYDVQVRGQVTVHGLDIPGPWSSIFTATTSASPSIGAISDLALYAQNTSLATFTFTPASSATSHQYRTSTDGGSTWSAAATLTNRTITGLSDTTTYAVQIRGTDGTNFGNWSNSVSLTTWSVARNVSDANVQAFTTGSGQTWDCLFQGVKWISSPAGQTPLVITYSFPTSASVYTDPSNLGGYGEGEPSGFVTLNSAQKTAVREILAWYGRLINVVFLEITEDATHTAVIRYAMTTNGSVPTAHTYYPGSLTGGEGGDVWLNTVNYNSPNKGSYAWHTFMHETGHALGLKHPFDSNAHFASVTNLWNEWTIMAYACNSGQTDGGGLSYITADGQGCQTPMRYDVAALQFLYGANLSTEAGETTYSWSPTTGQFSINGTPFGTAPDGNFVYMTVWDGGGTDTYDFSNYPHGSATASLTPGGFSTTASAQKSAQGGGPGALGNVYNSFENSVTGTKSDIESDVLPA